MLVGVFLKEGLDFEWKKWHPPRAKEMFQSKQKILKIHLMAEFLKPEFVSFRWKHSVTQGRYSGSSLERNISLQSTNSMTPHL